MRLVTNAPRPPRQQLVAAYVPAVARLAAAMLERDGTYHVGARYIPSASYAAHFRRLAAELLHGAALRGVPAAIAEVRALLHPAVQASTCVWCRRAIDLDTNPEQLGGRAIHPACLLAFDVTMAETRGEG